MTLSTPLILVSRSISLPIMSQSSMCITDSGCLESLRLFLTSSFRLSMSFCNDEEDIERAVHAIALETGKRTRAA